MKATTNTRFWKIIFLALGIGLLFGYTVGSIVKSNNRAESILEVLKTASQCDEVNQIIYAKGIQFGKEGISTEKGEYQLIGCEFKSVREEANRLNKVLSEKIKNYEKVDLIELEFVRNDQQETVLIKNGKIQ